MRAGRERQLLCENKGECGVSSGSERSSGNALRTLSKNNNKTSKSEARAYERASKLN